MGRTCSNHAARYPKESGVLYSVFHLGISINKIMLNANIKFWHKNNRKSLNNLILKIILFAVEELAHYASENF